MKKLLLASLAIVALILVGSAVATADTVALKVKVDVDNNGKVKFTGPDAARIDMVVQFCPWENRKKCAKNIFIKKGNDGTFQLDPGGLAHKQVDFNAKSGTLWMEFSYGESSPDDHVALGTNVEITDSPEGARLHYTGPIPAR